MARRTEVKVRISGDSKSAEAAARRSEGALKRLGGTIKRNLAASMLGATAIAYGLVRVFKSLINAANTQEDAIRGLDAALRPLGDAAAGVSKRLQEQAAALQQVTKYGDETIIKGQALLATFTQNEAEIARATKAALDLSAAVGVDLNAAFLLMGKAAKGETSTLSRYGIVLDKGLPLNEKFAAVLELLEEQMGGRAQEAAKTFSGRMAQLGNALGDVAERMGEGITKNDEMGSAISRTTDFVQKNEAALARLWTTIGEGAVALISGITDKFTQLGNAIGIVTSKAIELSGAYDVAEVKQSALEATAARFGITVEEVRERMAAAGGTITEVNTKLDEAGEGLDDLANKAGNAGNETVKLTDHFKTATDAALGLGSALGEVTSIELAVEIEKIREALAESTAEMDKNGAEYIRLEAIAAEKIESLQTRITNLRNGLGDLKTATKESGDEWTNYARGVDMASAATQRFTASAAAASAAASAGGAGGAGGMATGTLTQAEQRRGLGGETKGMPVTIGGGTFSGPAAGGAVSADLYLIGVRPQPGAPYGVYADGRVRGGGYLTA